MPMTPRSTLNYAQAAIADAEAEIAGTDEAKLKTLVAALKATITADAAALEDVIKLAADLRAKQAIWPRPAAAIEAEVDKTNQKLGVLRAEQGEKTAVAVQETRQTVIVTAAGALVLGCRAGLADRRQRLRPDPRHDRPHAVARRGRTRCSQFPGASRATRSAAWPALSKYSATMRSPCAAWRARQRRSAKRPRPIVSA